MLLRTLVLYFLLALAPCIYKCSLLHGECAKSESAAGSSLLQVASMSSRHKHFVDSKLTGEDSVNADQGPVPAKGHANAQGAPARSVVPAHPAKAAAPPKLHADAASPAKPAEPPAHAATQDHSASEGMHAVDDNSAHGLQGHAVVHSVGGDHAAGDDGVAHEKVSAHDVMSVAISATLTGAIIFVMAMFYLLNHADADIRRYSYEILDTTISIFSGILLFQGIHDVLNTYVLERLTLQWKFVANLLHMLCWLALLQLTLASFTGVLGPRIYKPTSKKKTTMNVKCWSVLLAHITGFASLNAWGTLQQAAFFKQLPGMELMVVPIAVCFLLVIQRITDVIREWVSLRGDQHKDKYELMWDENVEEAENDVMGFTTSFLLVQAARGYIYGKLPSASGEELESTVSTHNGSQVIQLCGVGLLFVVLVVIEMHGKLTRGWNGRFFVAMLTATCMGFAWSVFFATLWYLGTFPFLATNIVLLSVVQAVGLSILSFATIFALDWLADQDWTGEEFDKDIALIIGAIGFLVGFSWEQCFHHATHALSHHVHMQAGGKLLFSIMCLLIILPAWRFYILPMVIQQGWRFGFVPDQNTVQRALDHLKVASESELTEESL